MISWKTTLLGTFTTIVINLGCQLIFILAASFVGSADAGEFFTEYRDQLWFASAMLTQCISMALGGAATVLLYARHRHLLHAALTGALASLVSLLTLMATGEVNLMSMVLILLGTGFSAAGGQLIIRICARVPEEHEARVTG